MKNYDHKKIEKKWQKEWSVKNVYKTLDSSLDKKMYVLDMFPYPSGVGLHVGHPRGYIGSDVYARMKRMQGYNVLHPMGYDAFGLPAEQYALQHKIHPKKAVEENVKTFEKQLSMIGLSYDWSRKVNTTDPKYYKWTQWIFLKIYNSWYDKSKNKGRPILDLISIFEKSGNTKVNAVSNLDTENFTAKEWNSFSKKEKHDILMKYRLAYEGYSEVNWCPQMGTVLANDEIVNDVNGKPVSERGSFPVEKKLMRQWFMRITAYADRLLSGLDGLDWSDHIKEIQKNWIGKSEGSEIEFKIIISSSEVQPPKPHEVGPLKVFTTRADTIFGATYVVLAPEHPLIKNLELGIKNLEEVNKYIKSIKSKTDEDRVKNDKEKTGVELKGIKAINPANGEEIPVWVADYVLVNYGTGAVMAVPAHDERDFEFAKKYKLEIKQVIAPYFTKNPQDKDVVRLDKETIKRKTSYAFIFDKKNDRFLCLDWEKYNWHSGIIGGVDEGETYQDAALREIKEETGYVNLKYIKDLGGEQHNHFFAAHKDVNRYAVGVGMLFELIDEERNPTKEEDTKNHKTVWIKSSEMSKWLNLVCFEYMWQVYINNSECFVDDGILLNSGKFNDLKSEEACSEITKFVGGKIVTKYKMRDAIFARQRYWGEPIPLKHNRDGTISELKEKDLPLELPNVKSYESTGTGESPLAGVKSWVKENYETNTMPGWAGSSWYFLRYMDSKNSKNFISKKAVDYWKDVDVYVGGQEHATGHLLYSRFWNKFLYDMGYLSKDEPFKKLKNQGMILGSDSRKMSKRWGNVVNPDDIVFNYGADTLRVYEMFMGPFDQSLPWSTESIIGSRRFIDRVYRLQDKIVDKKSSPEVEKILHKTIKKVSEDIENFDFNTAISSMMIFMNEVEKFEINKNDFKIFLQILAPFASHITEELWNNLGEKKSIHKSKWPKYNPKKIIDEKTKIAVQVNGKVRMEFMIDKDEKDDEIKSKILKEKALLPWLENKEIKKVIYVPGRVFNIVI
jgi:leucyl-tRNA synthetase